MSTSIKSRQTVRVAHGELMHVAPVDSQRDPIEFIGSFSFTKKNPDRLIETRSPGTAGPQDPGITAWGRLPTPRRQPAYREFKFSEVRRESTISWRATVFGLGHTPRPKSVPCFQTADQVKGGAPLVTGQEADSNGP
ncbi:hypothetical protein DPEC_G00287610 [Dallia pectoralis]|uniref:Uncharacterized protein n=1 Tax=Dallia pectoralis TaxID=75939 RepID=A0ACC2FKD5_DALPE|nr:hypothetical protein DPEC_G00287610 [Dallia pectoralis]